MDNVMKKTSSKKIITTKKLIIMGMFAAVLAVLTQIAIPMPSGVPITLQTFGVALIGYILGARMGTISTLVYVILGAVGVPVFSNFLGGINVLFGYTGGFIFGFIIMALLCGWGGAFKNKVIRAILSLTGLIICHLLGTLQFSLLTGNGFLASLLLVSVPYIVKDMVSVFAAYLIAVRIKKRIINLI